MKTMNNPYMKETKEDGFSLTELLIVLAIIGILIMIAVPLYRNVTTRAKTLEARQQLSHLHTLQQSYRLEFDTFSTDFATIGYEHAKLISDGGTARYLIEIEKVSPNEYLATATSIIDFDGDGTFNKWQVDQQGVVTQLVAD